MNTSTSNNGTNSGNTSRISTNRYHNLPKFTILHPNNPRISSSTSTSPNESHHLNTRTISSSSSIISTPSNNIKRNRWKQQQQQQQQHQHQHQQQQQQQQKSQKHEKSKNIQTSKNGRLVKSKLLNLQQSTKLSFDDKCLVKISHDRKKTSPIIGSDRPYDYSIFTHFRNCENEEGVPATRESQIKAWESAERITHSVLFPSSDSEIEDEEQGSAISDGVNDCPIISIPGYTNAETKIIYQAYMHPHDLDEARMISEHRSNITRNRMDKESISSFMANSLMTKRNLQVSQKKEVYSRMFGQDNLMNEEYMTNNSTYSSVDNSGNLQKTLAEDKQEISQLLVEEKEHNLTQNEIRHLFETQAFDFEMNKKKRKNSNDSSESGHIDYDRFQSLTSKKLDKIYHDNIVQYEGEEVIEQDKDEEDEIMEHELLNFTTMFLRKKVKEVESSYL